MATIYINKPDKKYKKKWITIFLSLKPFNPAKSSRLQHWFPVAVEL